SPCFAPVVEECDWPARGANPWKRFRAENPTGAIGRATTGLRQRQGSAPSTVLYLRAAAPQNRRQPVIRPVRVVGAARRAVVVHVFRHGVKRGPCSLAESTRVARVVVNVHDGFEQRGVFAPGAFLGLAVTGE